MPPAEQARAIVWRIGEALLAVPLEAALEVAAVSADGMAMSRKGQLELRAPPGLPPVLDCRRAIIVVTRDGLVALPAESVDGVLPYSVQDTAATPPWLGRLTTDHLAGLIRLDDHRIAALLAVEALRR